MTQHEDALEAPPYVPGNDLEIIWYILPYQPPAYARHAVTCAGRLLVRRNARDPMRFDAWFQKNCIGHAETIEVAMALAEAEARWLHGRRVEQQATANDEGFTAGVDGKGEAVNPYEAETVPHRAWHTGWMMGVNIRFGGDDDDFKEA